MSSEDLDAGLFVFLAHARRDQADAGDGGQHQIVQRVDLPGRQLGHDSHVGRFAQAFEEVVRVDLGILQNFHKARIGAAGQRLTAADLRALDDQMDRVEREIGEFLARGFVELLDHRPQEHVAERDVARLVAHDVEGQSPSAAGSSWRDTCC